MDLWQRLKLAKKPIVLYGMGNGADRILDILEKLSVTVSGVFASDDFVRHQLFRGYTVCSYDELKSQFGDMIVLLAFGTQRTEVLDNVRRIANEQELYVPDIPVVGDEIFDESFVMKNKEKIIAVYNLLSDRRSKEVYEKIIMGKLTGDPKYLWEAEDDPVESRQLLSLTDHEVFLDLGAYNGDTALEFIRENSQYDKIIAVEPDAKNYRKCLYNLNEFPNVEVIHACIDQKSGVRRYMMDGGRKSASLASGGSEVLAISVDELMEGKRVSYIKMDVEGMEREAILGAKETLRQWKPKMLISAYHRSEDLFELPLLVSEILGRGAIYIRHYPYLPAWDTNFYFTFSEDEA